MPLNVVVFFLLKKNNKDDKQRKNVHDDLEVTGLEMQVPMLTAETGYTQLSVRALGEHSKALEYIPSTSGVFRVAWLSPVWTHTCKALLVLPCVADRDF